MNAKTRFRRKFPSKCNKPIVKWYKPHGAIHKTKFSANFQFTLPLRIKTAFLLMKLRKRYLKPIIKPNFPSVRDNPKQ